MMSALQSTKQGSRVYWTIDTPNYSTSNHETRGSVRCRKAGCPAVHAVDSLQLLAACCWIDVTRHGSVNYVDDLFLGIGGLMQHEKTGLQELQHHLPQQQGMEHNTCQQDPATSTYIMCADDQPARQDEEHIQQQTEQPAPAWQNYSSVFTAAKAGMGGVDQQKVKQVVYAMSKVRNFNM